MKDIEKRKRVMERSIRLGHCICDPKKPCPCDLLKEKNVCLCAGERLAVKEGPVRLTQLVEYAGCASKIDQKALKEVLGGLTFHSDPRVLIGVPAGDDAGVFQMGNGQAWVQTVDVFTPSVDDPYLFGQIAAANSVSDIYAMGGKPLTALSILGFPIRTVPDQVMRDILRGGIDKMAEAGVAIIGGHSINDKEIKAGFAVTGLIDPKKIMANTGALPGDVLILTKPLGTGILAFASQINRAEPVWMQAAAASMAALNKNAAEIMPAHGAHACTDITGFGLAGHVANIASASKVDIEIIWDDLPLLDGVLECTARGIASGGVERNRESSGHLVAADSGINSAMLDICFDPQTSGGLLIAVPEKDASPLLAELHAKGLPTAAVIGKVLQPGTGKVQVRTTGKRILPSKEDLSLKSQTPESCCAAPANQPCCGGSETHHPGTDVSETQRKFQEFLKTANAPGALDARTKQAVAVALSVLAKCEPCVKIHIQKARDMGFTQDQIDEAAWMAIAFGGSPLMMFYNQIRNL
jgi:selenide,water dikinase